MPLSSDIGENIKELRRANAAKKEKRSKEQILAIALEASRRAKEKEDSDQVSLLITRLKAGG